MLQLYTYVRCPIDTEDSTHPRTFAMAKIVGIDDFADTADLEFNDNYGLREYYSNFPNKCTMPLSFLVHCKIMQGAIVLYRGQRHRILSGKLDKGTDLYWYHIYSLSEDIVTHVPETELMASFNDSYINPREQMASYEFQNPVWFFGRTVVNKAVKQIENSTYGFKNIAGCKIYLKPHQLKTVVRCLSGNTCRYMIADEVGMGKTIEAASVLKIYIADNHDKKILIVAPDALVEQWRTELAFKFRLFEGLNANNNSITLIPVSKMSSVLYKEWDFVVVDEVHRFVNSSALYSSGLALSKKAKNIIMLSATPIQSRKTEFHKLLTLIQPNKYEFMSSEKFSNLLDMQSSVIKRIHSAYNCLDDYIAEIEDSEKQRTDETEELFEDLIDELNKVQKITGSEIVRDLIDNISYESKDFGVSKIKTVLSFICEGYQLEKCIIRNRRDFVKPSIDFKREVREIPYDIESDCNSTEYSIYSKLAILSDMHGRDLNFSADIIPLLRAFFSSSAAFRDEIQKHSGKSLDELNLLAQKWVSEDVTTIKNIDRVLANLDNEWSRIVGVIDFLDQNAGDKKTLVFTDFRGTFELYKKAFDKYFGADHCCYFSETMSSDELELNTYRFQTESKYNIMLSDKSGGEGRNFQMADYILHIDLPWSANDLEQRIGRLARIGREADKSVVSIVPFAQNTIEQDLYSFWKDGLGIFSKSQSGLEIIMPEVDMAIIGAIANDFRHGLSNIISEIAAKVAELNETVKLERHFDIAQYKYHALNLNIEKSIEMYRTLETDLFSSSMMGWATLAGLKCSSVDGDAVSFSAHSFQYNAANNSLLIPPDMKKVIDSKMNQMQNRIRNLNGSSSVGVTTSYIMGTFSREKAMKSDYMHFFAPGDEIYDSIIQNAVTSYKGKCAAIAVNGPFAWEGFVYSWSYVPDNVGLLENNISIRKLAQYRPYVPNFIYTNTVSIGKYDIPESLVLSLIEKLSTLRESELRKSVEHIGKRSSSRSFLGLPKTYPMSNMMLFESKHPKDIWEDIVRSCYDNARASAVEEYKKKLRLKTLREILENEQSELEASVDFYGAANSEKNAMDNSQIILDAFRKAAVVLDSICYVKVVK